MFYFSVSDEGWEVIDGQQRLTTILGYVEPNSIKDKKIRNRIIKKVDIRDGNKNIQKQQIVNTIKNDTYIYCVKIPDDTLNSNDKFEIFRALNQGQPLLNRKKLETQIFKRKFPI